MNVGRLRDRNPAIIDNDDERVREMAPQSESFITRDFGLSQEMIDKRMKDKRRGNYELALGQTIQSTWFGYDLDVRTILLVGWSCSTRREVRWR